MAKESRLRGSALPGNNYDFRGNGRELVDRDKVPEGCDPDVWHLALYFEQQTEKVGVSATAGRPVIYSELKYRLTNCPPPDIRTRARLNNINISWVVIVEKMIEHYFSYYEDNYYPINDFTNVEVFDHYLDYVIDTLAREQLLATSTRVVQPDREIKPSKRTEEEKEVSTILNRRYTEEELKDKLQEFKKRE